MACKALSILFLMHLVKLYVALPTTISTMKNNFEGGEGVLTEAQKALAQIADLPCVDEADMYFCFFEIIMRESCTNNIVAMMKSCRYTCAFC